MLLKLVTEIEIVLEIVYKSYFRRDKINGVRDNTKETVRKCRKLDIIVTLFFLYSMVLVFALFVMFNQ